MKKLFPLIIVLCLTGSLHSQNIMTRAGVFPKQSPDSLDIAYYSQKNWYITIGQVLTYNVGIWAFDRLILDTEYSKINFSTMKTNLKKGFVWDNDQMATNMFSHPYHGSLYYNAARSNGFNFWASGAFTFMGSLMWELFLENEYPSINDIIATPVGGIAVGEVLYRSSDLILDDRATGGERFFREFSAFLVSPARGVTRIIKGDAWRKRATTGRQFGMPNIHLEVSLGVRALELREPILDRGVGLTAAVNLDYGDKFNTDDIKPFDYFNILAYANIHKSQPILGQVNILGRLWATDIIYKPTHLMSLGIYQHLDYYDSEAISAGSQIPYKFCTPASLGIGLLYQRNNLKNTYYDAYAHFTGVMLGGSLSDYYRVDKRDYNLAAGYSGKAGFRLDIKQKLRITINYETYRLFTWKGYPDPNIDWATVEEREFNYMGDKSNATLHAMGVRIDLKLVKKLYATASFTYYDRNTRYHHYSDVFSNTGDLKLMFTYIF